MQFYVPNNPNSDYSYTYVICISYSVVGIIVNS